MFLSIADALATRLQAEQATGGTLEDIRLVRVGDHQPISILQQPAVVVDWDGARAFHADWQRVEFSAVLRVYLYTASQEGPEAAEREADRLVWDDSTGTPRGLLPALCRCTRTSLVIGGQSYRLAIGDEVHTFAVKDKAHSTGMSWVEVRAVTMRNAPT